MRQILLIIFLSSSMVSFCQHKGKFYFDMTVLSKNDTLTTESSFFLTANSKTFYPSIKRNSYQFNFNDSIVDFHLLVKKRHYTFKDVETYRLFRNHKWEITIDSLASETGYCIIVKQAGCFSNVLVGGNNCLCPDSSCPKNEIILTDLPKHRKFLKKQNN